MDPAAIDVIAPNFKRRLSGVTSTIIQLVPVQRRLGRRIAVLGPGLPTSLPHLHWRDLTQLWTPPAGRPARVWHARRNIEMLPGLILRDLLRMPLRLVFTSASQRRHTGWTKFLISRMDAVISTSQRTAHYLDRDSTVIRHGIDIERFAPAKDKAAARRALKLPEQAQIVGCFGRVRRQKGTDLFVDAMISLLPIRPDWIAVIAGRATAQHVAFERELKEKVARAGLSHRILFVGEHTNINDWYGVLDLFVAPQRWEGFGLTPLEAMASEVAVVATDVGAFSELVVIGAEETGIVVPAGQMGGLMGACAEFMDHPERRIAAGRRGRRHVAAQFTIEGEATAIGAVYDTVSGSSDRKP
ncbi:glycosyl transferase family 1 [Rhizobium rhizosphaerae]|uniref:Glycosyl transferase family 1 n=1 Tax=Xaviernesmea rhizosphaerae TaxID=1672749 RepID=A0A1Q9APC5_9HYPH|nr:glycosyltransferase family 4 protein [Xaviernesmea rhizosphaerae]OLP57276.1 glycosyl transferase family 1 [Xaviernesmea rhizosphaerae]